MSCRLLLAQRALRGPSGRQRTYDAWFCLSYGSPVLPGEDTARDVVDEDAPLVDAVADEQGRRGRLAIRSDEQIVVDRGRRVRAAARRGDWRVVGVVDLHALRERQ